MVSEKEVRLMMVCVSNLVVLLTILVSVYITGATLIIILYNSEK